MGFFHYFNKDFFHLSILLGLFTLVLTLNGCAQDTNADQDPQGECSCDISRVEFDALVERIVALEKLLGICTSNDQCSSGYYCDKANEDCTGDGFCQEVPTGCPDVWDPMCGCDGNTYGNACETAAAGVNVDYQGECMPSGCSSNDQCNTGEYCHKSGCDGTGVCNEIPSGCIDVWAPVCGCDGVTYSNSCYAAAAGVTINHEGECRLTLCDDASELICDMIPPACDEFEVLAIQNNCWVCVNPQTCLPWGEAGCTDDFDCPAGEVCDFCGTSSCPACDDCLPACVTAID